MFTIIIPWMSGNERREEIFIDMLECVSQQNFFDGDEVIIVEQKDTDEVKEVQLTSPTDTCSYRKIELHSKEAFNKAWCINVAARLAKNERLIVWDADMIVEESFLENISSLPVSLCWNKAILESGRDNPKERIISPSDTHALGGIWAIQRSVLFNELGGMNENYFGYGGEDCDLYRRAAYILYADMNTELFAQENTIRHPYHDWEPIDHSTRPMFARILDYTMANPALVTRRLKLADVGKVKEPSLIEMRIK